MWAAIFAAIESIPVILQLVQSAINEWTLYQLSKVDQEYSQKDKQRKALLEVLKQTECTDEQRKILVRLLYNLNHNP